ncbi:uncharacterized protein LOC126660936 [Mercurialis annua]|uniref:uncharacterized protein LOC126660936 n=1 Tax=Mercurialis annua TaxID=3986 RepID=UPI00215EBAA4|nr:uncharacterized protein LOC126660936 [Mercurialis annua]
MTRPHRTVTNWSELDSDLLSQIAGRINCLRDFIIFGVVCRWWRSVASPKNFNKSTKVPWLLLDQDHGDHSLQNFQLTFIHPSGGSVGVYSMIDGSYKLLFNEGDSGYRCSSQWIEPRL